VRFTFVRARNSSQRSRRKRGCTPATKSIACCTFSQRGSTATSAMKLTCRISSARCACGSRPSTRRLPSQRGQAEDRLQRRRLAGAVRADQADDAPGFDREGRVVQRVRRTVGLPQTLGFDQSRHVVAP
jgi:hypothetical protein